MHKILILLLLLLSGCSPSLSNIELKKAVQFCGSVDNIESIVKDYLDVRYVRCADGTQGHLRDIKLPRAKT